MKIALGIIAAGLSLWAYYPYFRDIKAGLTKPHAFTWLVWSCTAFVVAGGQLHSGAGAGAIMTIVDGVFCVVVLLVTLRRAEHDITRSDWIALGLTICSALVWAITSDPTMALVFALTTDFIAFVPTVRKTWNRPNTEPATAYLIGGSSCAVALMATANYNFDTVLNNGAWVVLNCGFAALVWIRLAQLRSVSSAMSPAPASSAMESDIVVADDPS